jgi:hypothetical protein
MNKIAGDSVHLEVKMVNGTFKGTLDGEASKLTGTWTPDSSNEA